MNINNSTHLSTLRNYFDDLKDVDEEVEKFLQSVDQQLTSYLKKGIRKISNVETLKEGIMYQLNTGGKRIRAGLCVTACELFGAPYVRALNYAASIEYLQNFTLIHDDIADGDVERRGLQSLWKLYGIGHAINIGDIFIPLSSISILESPYSENIKLKLVQVISELGLEIAEGQCMDINFRTNDLPNTQDYVKCTMKKTGSFLAMAVVGGGVIGGASETDLIALKNFSSLAGAAFQIKDDMLDLIGTKGRKVGSDILEGKRTLLVIHTASQASKTEKKRLFAILNKPRNVKSGAEVKWVCDLFNKYNALGHAEKIANQLVKKASRYIMDLPETEAKYRLLRITKYLSQRMY